MGLHNRDCFDVQYDLGQVPNDRLDVPFECEKRKLLNCVDLSWKHLGSNRF